MQDARHRTAFIVRLLLLCAALVGCQDLTIVDSNRCDGEENPGESGVDAPFDADGDGTFDAGNPDCAEVYGAADLDCDDRDPDVHPGAAEVACNGVDDDCDPATGDEGDGDADGVGECTDCDDGDPANYPGNSEVCDGQDNDCDGLADFDGGQEGDGDADGTIACADCDDADPANFPGNPEVCDGQDNDCNGLADLPDEDTDGDCDGALLCADCDDTNALVFPGAPELCDGLDNDCDASTGHPAGEGDADGDGQSPCAGDCDDGDPGAYGVDYASSVMQAAPFAYWRLGEPAGSCTAADQLGRYPLENIGMSFGTAGALFGDTDTAVTGPSPLDETDHRYLLHDQFPLSTQAFSVEFWFRTSAIHTTMISYAVPGQTNELTIVFDDVASHFIYIDSDPRRPNFATADGEWHHVVETWSAVGGAVDVWLDGATVWTSTLADGGAIDPGGCLVFGAEQDSVCGGFDTAQALRGDLDEVAIYTRVLTPVEILQHYEVGAGLSAGVGCD